MQRTMSKRPSRLQLLYTSAWLTRLAVRLVVAPGRWASAPAMRRRIMRAHLRNAWTALLVALGLRPTSALPATLPLKLILPRWMRR